MVAIGIDVSKLKFDVACIIDGKKISKTFENNSSVYIVVFMMNCLNG
jgi:hypothetical protein